MKTDCDCMVCCLAMFMGWTYEQAIYYFPPKAVLETGYQFKWLVPYLRANGIRLIWFGEPNLSSVDWSQPAMVDVPNLTNPIKGDHIIFWDGEKIIDPSNKTPKYIELPDAILNVYQLKI